MAGYIGVGMFQMKLVFYSILCFFPYVNLTLRISDGMAKFIILAIVYSLASSSRVTLQVTRMLYVRYWIFLGHVDR
ncbi:hypothetical protein BO85DRAFT_55540 [Aspergillus piperis CBS 112811]|uniref:Uncharacterized protein n=1 Tax=Aspergillus piperis CBS 112811 TaxID=1448313 RepID=A0A8G1VKJ7_9EURO|nr:hypothetical protein BO85DRAFT_55540 [Aspergillus piperis CBS 112811]RAH56616.1 hypothetical protein BO85DRAFT_55540 [Aspergillus piperis CBS 112811]